MTDSHVLAAGVSASWLSTLRRYLVFAIPAHFLWEMVQLPLYTIWQTESFGYVAFAVAHCTGGDIVIASMALLGSLLLFGTSRWPEERYVAAAAVALAAGLAYTVVSEWLNTEIRRSWTYSDLMPRLPLVGTGLSPFAQWIVIPLVAFWWARDPVALSNRTSRRTHSGSRLLPGAATSGTEPATHNTEQDDGGCER